MATCYRKKLIIQHKNNVLDACENAFYKEYKYGLTVAELIETEKIDNPLYVTVSVNEEFVEGGTFDKAVLKDGDRVEFLDFMGGGC